jgi:hypothetical protein
MRPVAASLLLVLGAVFLQAVQLPQRVFACSCAGPPKLADVVDNADAVVFVGKVGQQVGGRIPVSVSTWFHGAGAADLVWVEAGEIPDGRGGVMVNTCGPSFTQGETRLFVAYGVPPGLLSTSNCAPGARVDTPEGQALINEATLVFGAPQPPPSPVPEPAVPIDLAPWLGGLGWVAVLAAVSLAIFGAVALVARRQRPG